jgi:hypothetical protein
MTWTAQLTYTAGGLTSDDIDALTDALGDGGIVYGNDTGRLQITLEVEAPTLQDAADTVLRMTAAATGLLKLTRLQALTTAEFVAEIEHPAQGRGGGRQSCCCCADLVVEMQKIDKRPVIV